jgi:hypothetical protein
VALLDALLDQGVVIRLDPRAGPEPPASDRRSAASSQDVEYRLSSTGDEWMREFGLDLEALQASRRPLIRHCLDWSERRHHIAGALGQALAQRLFALGWLAPGKLSRVVTVSDHGAAALQARFGIKLDPV